MQRKTTVKKAVKAVKPIKAVKPADNARMLDEIEKALLKAHVTFTGIDISKGWITVYVLPGEASDISSKVCKALNPKFGYQIITSSKNIFPKVSKKRQSMRGKSFKQLQRDMMLEDLKKYAGMI